MDNNFITVEKAYLLDLIRAKSRMEIIIDCLLEKTIPGYERYDANELSASYFDSQLGMKIDEPTMAPKEPKIKINQRDLEMYKSLDTLTKGA